ncbi:MAG: hypothetical protein ACK55Z_35035, partial [bacterium]
GIGFDLILLRHIGSSANEWRIDPAPSGHVGRERLDRIVVFGLGRNHRHGRHHVARTRIGITPHGVRHRHRRERDAA